MAQTTRTFDRTKFRGTNMSELKTQDQQVSKTIGESSGLTRAGYLEIKDGTQYFRIYPHHNAVLEMLGESNEKDKGKTFAENRVIYYLPMMVEEKDDKGNIKKDAKGRSILKEIQKAIFDSRVHGDTPKDIIDEYIKFVNNYAIQNIQDEEQRNLFLRPIVGDWPKKIPGLSAKSSWVVYAEQIFPKGKDASGQGYVYDYKFGKLEFGKAVRYGLNTLSAQEKANQPLGTDDVFSDPNEGIAIQVTYNKEEKNPQLKYQIGFYQPRLGGGMIQMFELDDSKLTKLLEYESLYIQYKNVYRKRDFKLALEGLRLFDSKYEFNMMEEPEFLAIIEEIQDYYPDTDETANTTTSNEDVVTEPGEETQTIEQDQFDLMNREELKAWHKENKTLVVLPKHTEDFLREKARESFKALKTESTVTSGNAQQEEKVVVPADNGTGVKTAAQIAKEKLNAMKNGKK